MGSAGMERGVWRDVLSGQGTHLLDNTNDTAAVLLALASNLRYYTGYGQFPSVYCSCFNPFQFPHPQIQPEPRETAAVTVTSTRDIDDT